MWSQAASGGFDQRLGQVHRAQGVNKAAHRHTGVVLINDAVAVRVGDMPAIHDLAGAAGPALGGDAYEFSFVVDRRAPAISSGDGSIGLDPGPAGDALLAGKAAHLAARVGDRLPADAGIAEDEEVVADLQEVRIAQRKRRQVESIRVHRRAVEKVGDPYHRQVQVRIVLDDLGPVGRLGRFVGAGGEGDDQEVVVELRVVPHGPGQGHVAVGQDQPIGGNDRPRTGPFGLDPIAPGLLHGDDLDHRLEHLAAKRSAEVGLGRLGEEGKEGQEQGEYEAQSKKETLHQFLLAGLSPAYLFLAEGAYQGQEKPLSPGIVLLGGGEGEDIDPRLSDEEVVLAVHHHREGTPERVGLHLYVGKGDVETFPSIDLDPCLQRQFAVAGPLAGFPLDGQVTLDDAEGIVLGERPALEGDGGAGWGRAEVFHLEKVRGLEVGLAHPAGRVVQPEAVPLVLHGTRLGQHLEHRADDQGEEEDADDDPGHPAVAPPGSGPDLCCGNYRCFAHGCAPYSPPAWGARRERRWMR